MKKVYKLLLAFGLLLTLSACTIDKSNDNNIDNKVSNDQNLNMDIIDKDTNLNNNKDIVNNELSDQKDETLTKKSIKEAKVSSITNQTYTGKSIKPSITVTLNNEELIKDKDYTVSYSNNTKVGTASVVISGTGDYEGEVKTTFKIVEAKKDENTSGNSNPNNSEINNTGSNNTAESVKKITIKNDNNQFSCYQDHEYTGKEIRPKVTIKINGKTLKENTDYTIRYYDNIEVGKGKYEVTGIGDYEGTVTGSFEILEKAKTCSRTSITLYEATTYHIYKGFFYCSNGTFGNDTADKLVELGLMKPGETGWMDAPTEFYDKESGDLIRFVSADNVSHKDYDFYVNKCGGIMSVPISVK